MTVDVRSFPAPELVRVAPEDLCPDYADGWPREDSGQMLAYMQAKVLDTSAAFVPPRYRTALEMPVKAKEWADAIIAGAEPSNLVLMGPPGTGKTHSSCAVARYLTACWEKAHRGPTSMLFRPATDLLFAMKDYGRDADREGAYDEASRSGVLVLDDVARTKTTEVDVESLTRVIDRRMRSLRPTIITTNVFPDSAIVEVFGDHLASRLLGGSTTILVGGPDRRYATT